MPAQMTINATLKSEVDLAVSAGVLSEAEKNRILLQPDTNMLFWIIAQNHPITSVPKYSLEGLSGGIQLAQKLVKALFDKISTAIISEFTTRPRDFTGAAFEFAATKYQIPVVRLVYAQNWLEGSSAQSYINNAINNAIEGIRILEVEILKSKSKDKWFADIASWIESNERPVGAQARSSGILKVCVAVGATYFLWNQFKPKVIA